MPKIAPNRPEVPSRAPMALSCDGHFCRTKRSEYARYHGCNKFAGNKYEGNKETIRTQANHGS